MAGVPRHHRGRPDDGTTARVHLFPTPAALAAYCRTSTDHDLADHPVWPVVVGLGAADLTPDDDHRFDLDGVYDIAAENPDRWAVEELAATIDIVSRLAECLDTTPEPDEELDDAETEGQFEAVAELAGKPEIGSLGPGRRGLRRPFRRGRLGRRRRRARRPLGGRRRGAVRAPGLDRRRDGGPRGLPVGLGEPRSSDPDDAAEGDQADDTVLGTTTAGRAHDRPRRPDRRLPRRGGRGGKFWESVGILPVEIVVPEGAGVTLRCYVEDVARFLGRNGEVFLFDAPADLARFVKGTEDHDLMEIASWAEVADTDVPPLPADQDRYDLTELSRSSARSPTAPPGSSTTARSRSRSRGSATSRSTPA